MINIGPSLTSTGMSLIKFHFVVVLESFFITFFLFLTISQVGPSAQLAP